MWTIIKIIFFPFTFLFYLIKYGVIYTWYFLVFIFRLIAVIVLFIMWILQVLVNLLGKIFNFSVNMFSWLNKSSAFDFLERNKFKKEDWDDENFEEEAELWGLTKEERRIAKEEGMSPADFIEAEERDDDELFTDEWE